MISVVTVNYKTMDYTLRMLESLFLHHSKEDVEVFVVENASGDSVTQLVEQFPQVHLIQTQTNLGFAGGCNQAMKQATGDFIVLVNPDILFDHDALFQIAEKMKHSSDIGIGGISLKNIDGTQQACVWSFPQPLDQCLLLFKIPHLFPHTKSLKRWLMKDFDYRQSSDVDQVMGAFFCIRRQVIEEIGMLDDGFFMWYEEVDFCQRAKKAGWRIRYYADIQTRHKKGASFDQIRTMKKQSILRRSIRRYMFKHYGVSTGIVFLILEPFFWMASLLASVIKPQ